MAAAAHPPNKAVVLTELKKFVLEERPYPKAHKNQVVVQIRSVGVCGSDVHYYAHGQCGAFKVNGPIVLGHECAGVITDVGHGVTGLAVGDRVALEPGLPCRICEMCRTGKYNLCPDVEFLATPPFDGALARFILHEADYCFKIPDHVSFEEAALLEPFSVGVYACERGQVTAGHSVLITGAGPIGLTALLAAKAFGATNIILADINAFRLDVAKKMGATSVVNSSNADFHKQVLELVPRGVDVSIDCSGAEGAIRGAVLATKNGGKFCSVGRSAAVNVNFPLFDAADREVDIVGVFRYKNVYPKALELVASGRVDLKPLISHRYDLEHAEEAFQTALTGKGNPIKVAINF